MRTYQTAKVVLGKRTKELVKNLQGGEIVVLDHADLDELAAEMLIAKRVQAVLNVAPTITGRYRSKGTLLLNNAGIKLVDNIDQDIFERLSDGDLISIDGGDIYRDKEFIAKGRVLSGSLIKELLEKAENNEEILLQDFVDNTLEYASKEKIVLLQKIPLPRLDVSLRYQFVVVAVRGPGYREDLAAIRGFIEEEKPILIGVDGGADALLECGFRPDIIIGDMDSVSDEALSKAKNIIVHAYPNGEAPGMTRIKELKLKAEIMALPGTSEDVAMLLAYQGGASMIVAVGTHSNLVDFLEKGRSGMASTLLVRLKVGDRLIDAKGVSRLYQRRFTMKELGWLLIAALVPLFALIFISPSIYGFFQSLFIRLRLIFL